MKPSKSNNTDKKSSFLAISQLVDTSYQERFLKRFIFLIISIVLIQTTYFIFNDTLMQAAFNCLVLVGLWVSLLVLKKHSYELTSSLVILLTLSLVMFSVLTTGLGNNTIFWFFIFPIIATFLKGKHGGSIWLLILVLILATMFVGVDLGYIQVLEISYDASTFQQLILSIFLVAIFIYFYQDSLDQKAIMLKEKEEKLASIYTRLQEEIKRREKIGETLEQNLEALGHKEARDLALLQSIGEGVIATDASGEIIMINSVVEKMFNLYEKDVLGKSYSETFTLYNESGNPIPPSQSPLRQTIDKQEPQKSDRYFYRNYNGQPFPAVITASPILLDGQHIGVVEVFRDISEEKAIAKAKDEFISLASHQLRTPLSAIKWYAERLLKTLKLNSKDKEYMQTIYEDSARMSGLLSDYLNVSRLELKTENLNIAKINPEDVIKNILKDLNPLIKDKSLKVETKMSGTINIHTDSKLLDMIAQNLISNAVKYTPENGQVTISLSKYSGKDSHLQGGLVMNVEDTGMGIPEAEQSKLFTKLFRAKNALTSNVEGTGLGLYTMKAAIDRLGGIVWFDSKPGGTSFAVTIPDMKDFKDVKTDEEE
ncbi:MAG: PAS domain-containing sensor histidine kinase [Candidatus Saccharimonadales bacterium]